MDDQALLEVLGHGDLTHVFQPIWDVKTEQLLGFEALARFGSGVAPPRVFQEAMGAGLGLPLDRLSVRRALEAATDLPGLLFVNMKPQHVGSPKPPFGQVGQAIRTFRTRASVVMELTEDELADLSPTTSGVRRLRRLGVEVALDDAGNAGSNVDRLERLNPSYVKLDRPLVAAWASGRSQELTRWVSQAHAIGAAVIAEGVEDASLIPMLAANGISFVQGYAVGAPRSKDAWVEELNTLAPYRLDLATRYHTPFSWRHGRPGASVPTLSLRELSEHIYYGLPVPILVLSPSGHVMGMNPEAERLWQTFTEQVQETPVSHALGIRVVGSGGEPVPLEHLDSVRHPNREATPVRHDVVIRTPENEILRVDAAIIPLVHEGTPCSLVVLVLPGEVLDRRADQPGLPPLSSWVRESDRLAGGGVAARIEIAGLTEFRKRAGLKVAEQALRLAARALQESIPGALLYLDPPVHLVVICPGVDRAAVLTGHAAAADRLQALLREYDLDPTAVSLVPRVAKYGPDRLRTALRRLTHAKPGLSRAASQ